MADVTYHIDADVPLKELMRRGIQAANEIRHEWEELTLRSYHESGRPPGSWPALKASTLKRKADIVEDPHWMLLRTGKMISSNHFEIIQKADCVIVSATNSAPYWKYHEMGTRNVPARPQLDPQLYRDVFTKIIHKYFKEK